MDAADTLILVEYKPRYWRVMYPTVVLQHEALFQQGKALHLSAPLEAERIYRQVMAACGELYLDAVSHLGMLLNNRTPGLGTTYRGSFSKRADLHAKPCYQKG